VLRLLRIAFWTAATIAFVMAILPHPPTIRVWDKLQHMVAFLVITLLGCAAYPRFSRLKLLLALVAFGGFIEVVQAIPVIHRDTDWHDWLADIIAITLAFAGYLAAHRILASRPD
jgi:hypothetical protein